MKPLKADPSTPNYPHTARPDDALEARWCLLDANPEARAVLLAGANATDSARHAHNIENFIGFAKLPIGLAGPLRVNGVHAAGDYYLPLATTEATLVASYGRGCKLISAAGGCRARILDEGMTRSPGFVFRDLDEACSFVEWVADRRAEIEAVAASTTRHGKLIRLAATVEGNHVYLDFDYTTGDAAGQNMATFATETACRHILGHTPVQPRAYFIDANHSGDKKASARSLMKVRGRRVSAEVAIPPELVREHLHTEASRMADYWRLAALGAVQSGTLGVQGHYANGLAALYLACGQDVACVAESAVGVTRLELDDEGRLYAAVTLPSIVVGTVGGGTCLPTQRACLELMGLAGEGHAPALAEVCAGLALAGELSLIGAFCADQFAAAHRRFARGGPPAGAEA